MLSFLSLSGFDIFMENFEANNVDGEVLTKLTRATLKTELGIESLGAREKLLKAIDHFRIKQSRPASARAHSPATGM